MKTNYTHTFDCTSGEYFFAKNWLCQVVINLADRLGIDWSKHPKLTNSMKWEIGYLLGIRLILDTGKPIGLNIHMKGMLDEETGQQL